MGSSKVWCWIVTRRRGAERINSLTCPIHGGVDPAGTDPFVVLPWAQNVVQNLLLLLPVVLFGGRVRRVAAEREGLALIAWQIRRFKFRDLIWKFI